MNYIYQTLDMLKDIEPIFKKRDSYLKRCFIPNCTNNSSNTEKKFIKIPSEPELKKLWYEKASMYKFSSNREYCCEDHFDLKHDADNYNELCTTPGCEIILKKAVLPHKKLKTDTTKSFTRKPQKLLNDCESCEKERKNCNMIFTYCEDYINFNDFFAESDHVSSDDSSCENLFTTDLLFSTDKSFSDNNSLNLKSASEIDMGTSKLYVPHRNAHYLQNY